METVVGNGALVVGKTNTYCEYMCKKVEGGNFALCGVEASSIDRNGGIYKLCPPFTYKLCPSMLLDIKS